MPNMRNTLRSLTCLDDYKIMILKRLKTFIKEDLIYFTVCVNECAIMNFTFL